MKENPLTEITVQDLVTNSIFRLDMTVLRGRGVLRRPVKDLVKVVLHRLGVKFSLERTDKGWVVKAAVCGSRKLLPGSRMVHETSEKAENEFLLSTLRSLPQEIRDALSRVNQ